MSQLEERKTHGDPALQSQTHRQQDGSSKNDDTKLAVAKVIQCFSLSTIETDVSSREEEGDHVGEGPGGRHHRPEQRDREDDQGGGEVESVDIAQTQH